MDLVRNLLDLPSAINVLNKRHGPFPTTEGRDKLVTNAIGELQTGGEKLKILFRRASSLNISVAGDVRAHTLCFVNRNNNTVVEKLEILFLVAFLPSAPLPASFRCFSIIHFSPIVAATALRLSENWEISFLPSLLLSGALVVGACCSIEKREKESFVNGTRVIHSKDSRRRSHRVQRTLSFADVCRRLLACNDRSVLTSHAFLIIFF